MPPLMMGGIGGGAASTIVGSASMVAGGGRRASVASGAGGGTTVVSGLTGDMGAAAGLRLDELMRMVRHNKGKKLATALKSLPEKRFDMSIIKAPFVPGFGTQYDDALNALPFHINQADDNGNSLILTAAQNGLLSVSKLLTSRGANVNHQNSRGNTALHYALAYNFTELAEWLVSADGAGAEDTIMNQDGLTPYDGLEVEEGGF